MGLELDRSYFGERRRGEERSNREEDSAGFYEKKCAAAGRNVRKEENGGKIKWRETAGFNLKVTVDKRNELFRGTKNSLVKKNQDALPRHPYFILELSVSLMNI